MDDQAMECRRIQDETRSVLEYLAAEFQQQLTFAGQELIQTQAILQSAVDTLTESFTRIHDGIWMIGQTASHETEPAIQHLSAQLETEIDSAVRSLQFQDLTRQLVEHAAHRITAMQNALADIKNMAEESHDNTASFIDYLYRHKESVLTKVASIDQHKSNPVAQSHMGSGESELF